jgi:hypothetical protein
MGVHEPLNISEVGSGPILITHLIQDEHVRTDIRATETVTLHSSMHYKKAITGQAQPTIGI